MQFFITAYDGKDSDALERRMRVRPRHLENMSRIKERGRVICAGGITDPQGKPVGSVLILEFETRELLDQYLETEPYVTEGVWQEVRVEPMNVVLVNDEMVGK